MIKKNIVLSVVKVALALFFLAVIPINSVHLNASSTMSNDLGDVVSSPGWSTIQGVETETPSTNEKTPTEIPYIRFFFDAVYVGEYSEKEQLITYEIINNESGELKRNPNAPIWNGATFIMLGNDSTSLEIKGLREEASKIQSGRLIDARDQTQVAEKKVRDLFLSTKEKDPAIVSDTYIDYYSFLTTKMNSPNPEEIGPPKDKLTVEEKNYRGEYDLFKKELETLELVESEVGKILASIAEKEEKLSGLNFTSEFCETFVKDKWETYDVYYRGKQTKFDLNVCKMVAPMMYKHYELKNDSLISSNPNISMIEREKIYSVESPISLALNSPIYLQEVKSWDMSGTISNVFIGAVSILAIIAAIILLLIPMSLYYICIVLIRIGDSDIIKDTVNLIYNTFSKIIGLNNPEFFTGFNTTALTAFVILLIIILAAGFIIQKIVSATGGVGKLLRSTYKYLIHFVIALVIFNTIIPNLSGINDLAHNSFKGLTSFVSKSITGEETTAVSKKIDLFNMVAMAPFMEANLGNVDLNKVDNFGQFCYKGNSSQVIMGGENKKFKRVTPNENKGVAFIEIPDGLREVSSEFRMYNILNSEITGNGGYDILKYEAQSTEKELIGCSKYAFGGPNTMGAAGNKIMAYLSALVISTIPIIFMTLLMLFTMFMMLIVSTRFFFIIVDSFMLMMMMMAKAIGTASSMVTSLVDVGGIFKREKKGAGDSITQTLSFFKTSDPWGDFVKKMYAHLTWIAVAALVEVSVTVIFKLVGVVTLIMYSQSLLMRLFYTILNVLLLIYINSNRDIFLKWMKAFGGWMKDNVWGALKVGFTAGSSKTAGEAFSENGLTLDNMIGNVGSMLSEIGGNIKEGKIGVENANFDIFESGKRMMNEGLERAGLNKTEYAKNRMKLQKSSADVDSLFEEFDSFTGETLGSINSILNNKESYVGGEVENGLTEKAARSVEKLQREGIKKSNNFLSKVEDSAELIGENAANEFKGSIGKFNGQMLSEKIITEDMLKDNSGLKSNLRDGLSEIGQGISDKRLFQKDLAQEDIINEEGKWKGVKIGDSFEMDSDGVMNFNPSYEDLETQNPFGDGFARSKIIVDDDEKHANSKKILEDVMSGLKESNVGVRDKIFDNDFDAEEGKKIIFDKIDKQEEVLNQNKENLTNGQIIQAEKLIDSARSAQETMFDAGFIAKEKRKDQDVKDILDDYLGSGDVVSKQEKLKEEIGSMDKMLKDANISKENKLEIIKEKENLSKYADILDKQQDSLKNNKEFDLKGEIYLNELKKEKGSSYSFMDDTESKNIFDILNNKLEDVKGIEERENIIDDFRTNYKEYVPNTESYQSRGSQYSKMEQELRQEKVFGIIDNIQDGSLNSKNSTKVFSGSAQNDTVKEKIKKAKELADASNKERDDIREQLENASKNKKDPVSNVL